MKITEIINRIVKEGCLEDQSSIGIVKWMIENKGKEDLSSIYQPLKKRICKP